MNHLTRHLYLPAEITRFERAHLARTNEVASWFFALHVPVFAGVAALNGTGVFAAIASTLLLLAGPMLAARVFSNPRYVSMTFGFTAMGLGGLLVHFGQGPMQIEMHFYFFVLLALLAVFANPAVILTAAATVTLHHVVLWLILPSSVFNYEASLWTVVVHALFVVLESVAACYVARSFFDNVIGLERIVAARTAEIEQRHRELRLVFDAVEQGIATLNRDGTMTDAQSAKLTTFLGPAASGERFSECLARVDPGVAARFEMGWEALLDDVLPLELALDQMPRAVVAAGRNLRFGYTPILDQGGLSQVLLVLTDETAELARAAAEADRADLLRVIDRIQHDKLGFLEFLGEGEEILAGLRAGADLPLGQRLLHTLKGNAALFGMSRVADACHALETRSAETGDPPSADAIADVAALWDGTRQRLGALIGDEVRDRVELDEAEYAEILEAARKSRPASELVRIIRGWKREPMRRRFRRIADQAQAVAQRLGKDPLDVEIIEQGERLDAREWAPFWAAFVHVVRNAVDHGIEEPAARKAAGKVKSGRLTLAMAGDADAVTVSIADDGRGIDWPAVDLRARALGLPTTTDEDLRRALLRDGLTTRDEAGAFSGRGVGMGAVAEACCDRGGAMTIHSTAGRGTTIAFRFPRTA